MAHRRKPPSQTWRTFLSKPAKQLASTDFFVVPTVSFRILYVFVVLAHHRRRVVHFNVTAHPTSEWTTRQMAEAFPWDTAPRYLLRDRDSTYGDSCRQTVRSLGIREVLTAPRSPWQYPYAERLVGSIRRECLDPLLVFCRTSYPACSSAVRMISRARCHRKTPTTMSKTTAPAHAATRGVPTEVLVGIMLALLSLLCLYRGCDFYLARKCQFADIRLLIGFARPKPDAVKRQLVSRDGEVSITREVARD